jgi:hypothetical protein
LLLRSVLVGDEATCLGCSPGRSSFSLFPGLLTVPGTGALPVGYSLGVRGRAAFVIWASQFTPWMHRPVCGGKPRLHVAAGSPVLHLRLA